MRVPLALSITAIALAALGLAWPEPDHRTTVIHASPPLSDHQEAGSDSSDPRIDHLERRVATLELALRELAHAWTREEPAPARSVRDLDQAELERRVQVHKAATGSSSNQAQRNGVDVQTPNTGR